MATIKVGDRIECDGYLATVRFTGNLAQSDGSTKVSDALWIGVEWDDPNRGKHDGSFKGVRYFETDHPSAGSFLRPEKCNKGVSYMSALSSRYGLEVGGDSLNSEEDLFVCGKNQQTAVTAVGLEEIGRKQSRFEELRAVSVRGTYVSYVGNVDEISTNSKSLIELDLSLNLLSSWEDVKRIIAHMPRLKSLNVSENRLRPPQSEDDEINGLVFVTVQSLFMNRMTYDWKCLYSCIKSFPVLENLHACYNRIDHLYDVMTLPCSNHIRLINLEGNPIDSWQEIITLGELRHLETLILNECKLKEIFFPGNVLTQTDLFPAVQSLSICGNELSEWSSLNQINRLRSLTNLRITRNPLKVESTRLSIRQVVIAKISGLKNCNGAAIPRVERHDAELSYMIDFGAAWKALKSDSKEFDQFTQSHPRYQELIRIYGALEDSEVVPAPTSALKNSLVSVRIETKLSERPPLVKQLPLKMTVQRLKMLTQRAFGVSDLSSLRLFHVSARKNVCLDKANTKELCADGKTDDVRQHVENGAVARVELDNDLRDLSFYSIEDNAVVLAEW